MAVAEEVSDSHVAARLLTLELAGCGMGKCCVSGAGAINVDYKTRTVEIEGITLKEGDFISLNGTTGEVYKGKVETKAAEV